MNALELSDWESSTASESNVDAGSPTSAVVDGGLEVRRHRKKQRLARKRRERATAWRARQR